MTAFKEISVEDYKKLLDNRQHTYAKTFKNVVDYLKNNISKSYLKNIYNILFYDKKTQINFRNLFYEKVFDINSKQNDFIEMNFKNLFTI